MYCALWLGTASLGSLRGLFHDTRVALCNCCNVVLRDFLKVSALFLRNFIGLRAAASSCSLVFGARVVPPRPRHLQHRLVDGLRMGGRREVRGGGGGGGGGRSTSCILLLVVVGQRKGRKRLFQNPCLWSLVTFGYGLRRPSLPSTPLIYCRSQWPVPQSLMQQPHGNGQ